MNPESMDEAFGELFEALESATSAADKVARVRAMADKWEPTFPGIRTEFESMAGLAKLFKKSTPAAQHPAVPTSLPGFADLTPIGAGGYGVVCRAVQFPFRRQVAVKIRAASASASAEERFEREQRILAGLHHTNIVPVHLSGRHGPYQFFVMKLIDGATLADLVSVLADRKAPPAAISTLADHAAQTADSRSHERTRDSTPTTTRVPPPADDSPPATFPAVPPLAYFRSVAAVIASAADALAHAHSHAVLHRDIKPSNIMVGRDGVCSIIDFGLAAVSSADPDSDARNTGDALTRGALGTTPYMAPEQFHQKPEVRSDVWGLGATLYELLTLRRAYPNGAFKDREWTIPADEPAAPRDVCAAVPPDLDAICRKALNRDAADRYASPADLADDLRRWQRGEATAALPRGPLTRAWMWARRNPAWSGMMLSVVAALVVGAAAVFWSAKAEAADAKATAAKAEAATESANARAAEEREKDRQREALVMAIQGRRLVRYYPTGWYEKLVQTVRDAAARRNDEPLRTQAVALLSGIDAIARPSFPDIHGSSVAFDPKGRLLIGGSKFDVGGKLETEPTHLWDGTVGKPEPSKQTGPGPVAFRPDGTALQLAVTPEDRNTLSLWDVGGQKRVRYLTVPGAKKKDPLEKGGYDLGAMMALSSDGKFAAASIRSQPGPAPTYQTLVWDTGTGEVLFNDIPPLAPTVLTVAPADANGKSFLAVGDRQGQVTTWSLPDGKKLSTLNVGQWSVTALAAGWDVLRHDRAVPVPALRNRLLAVGGGGGQVSVWELETSSVRSFSHGSAYTVYSLAFSPDGVTLASGGRHNPRLWDASTGQLLLELDSMDYVFGITFSADGRTVAYTGRTIFNAEPAGTHLRTVENGRGTQTLRGLTTSVIRAIWSPDGNLVAGLTHDWRIGVWDRRTGLLLHRFEVPESRFVDNVSLAFSADSRNLAYAGGRGAFHWDLATGKQNGDWPLPEALSNHLIYAGPDKLYLFRQESPGSRVGPFGATKENPRICRIRNLLGDPNKLILDSDAMRHGVRIAAAAVRESCFLVEGTVIVEGKPVRHLKAYDAATGKEMWSKATKLGPRDGLAMTDQDFKGEFLSVLPENGRLVVWRIRTGEEVDVPLEGFRGRGSPKGFYIDTEGGLGMLLRRGENKPLFRLGIDDTRTAPPDMIFDPTGTRVLWPTADGAVRVCDLTTVQERLAALGLNW